MQPRWETYHVGELVPWIDATYRTIAARRGRAIAGLSMGGYGALSYAARHPGTFAAAASFSGALEVGSAAAWGPSAAPTRRAGARTCRSRSPRGCGRSRSSSCARATDGRARSIAAARGRAAGVRARALPVRSNVRLHARLRALGIRHMWDDYGRGTHDWPYWRRDLRETLPDLARVLARATLSDAPSARRSAS